MALSTCEVSQPSLHWQDTSNVGSLPYRYGSRLSFIGYTLWAKDIVLVISDGHLDGMHAWLSAYHGFEHSSEYPHLHLLHFLTCMQMSSRTLWSCLAV